MTLHALSCAENTALQAPILRNNLYSSGPVISRSEWLESGLSSLSGWC